MRELETLLGFPLRVGIPNTRPVRKTMEIPKDAVEKYLKGLLGTQTTGMEVFVFGRLSSRRGSRSDSHFQTLMNMPATQKLRGKEKSHMVWQIQVLLSVLLG